MPAQAQKPSMVQVTLRSSFWLTNRELFWLKPWVIAFRSLHQVLYASQASDSASSAAFSASFAFSAL